MTSSTHRTHKAGLYLGTRSRICFLRGNGSGLCAVIESRLLTASSRAFFDSPSSQAVMAFLAFSSSKE